MLVLYAACFTLVTRYRLAKPAGARVYEERYSCVQPKPTRSTVPNAKDVDAAFDRALRAINADKLKRYALFDTVSRGGTQRADGWYQDNVEPAVTCAREERAGPAGEGGKGLCDPNRLRAQGADCLIYSVGSFDDFSFEEAIMRDVSSACEIHVFDHTVSNPRNKPCGVVPAGTTRCNSA